MATVPVQPSPAAQPIESVEARFRRLAAAWEQATGHQTNGSHVSRSRQQKRSTSGPRRLISGRSDDCWPLVIERGGPSPAPRQPPVDGIAPPPIRSAEPPVMAGRALSP